MRETGKETQMKDTTMKDTTRATISRRELVTAASIVPFAAVRGSAQNSAVTVGLIGCGGRGTHDGMTLAKNVPGARLVALADLFPEKIEAAKKAAHGGERYDVGSRDKFTARNSRSSCILHCRVLHLVLLSRLSDRTSVVQGK